MTAYPPMSRRVFLGAVGAGATALGLAACSSGNSSGSGSGSSSGGDPNAAQTINWWHSANTEPMLPIWQQLADAYHAQHSNVTTQVTPIANEELKAKMTTETQCGNTQDQIHNGGDG